MRNEYAEIYLWAGTYASSRHYNKPREHFTEIIRHVVEDKEITKRSVRYFHPYRDLCQTIRTRVVNVQAKREKVIKVDIQDNGKEPPKASMGGVDQLSLF